MMQSICLFVVVDAVVHVKQLHLLIVQPNDKATITLCPQLVDAIAHVVVIAMPLL